MTNSYFSEGLKPPTSHNQLIILQCFIVTASYYLVQLFHHNISGNVWIKIGICGNAYVDEEIDAYILCMFILIITCNAHSYFNTNTHTYIIIYIHTCTVYIYTVYIYTVHIYIHIHTHYSHALHIQYLCQCVVQCGRRQLQASPSTVAPSPVSSPHGAHGGNEVAREKLQQARFTELWRFTMGYSH